MNRALHRNVRWSRKRGGALIAVMVFLSLAMTTAVLALTDAKARRESVLLQKSRYEAFYAAEVGLYVAIAKLNDKGNPNVDGEVSIMRSSQTSQSLDSSGAFDLFTEITDPTGAIYQSPFSGETTANTTGTQTQVSGTDQDQDGFLDFGTGTSWIDQINSFRTKTNGSFAVRARGFNAAASSGSQELRAFGVSNGIVRVISAAGTPKNHESTPSAEGQGFYAGESFLGGGNVSVDSFNSNNGGYGATYTDDNGTSQTNIGSNVIIGSNQTVDIGGSSFTIDGQVGSGQGVSGINAGSIDSSKIIQDALPEVNIPTPDTTVPSGATALTGSSWYSATTVGNGQNRTYVPADLGAGTYSSGALAFRNSNDQVRITGAVKLYITGDLNINGGGFTIAPGGSLEIFVQGSIGINGNAFLNETNVPANMILNSSAVDGPGDNQASVTFNGGSTFTGVVKAPDATVKMLGTNTVYGAVFGNTLDTTGTLNLHYDEALGIGGANQNGDPIDYELTASYEITADPADLEAKYGTSSTGG